MDPKTIFEAENSFEPYPDPKNSPLGPQKVKMTPKLSKFQISELTETYKMKVVQVHE